MAAKPFVRCKKGPAALPRAASTAYIRMKICPSSRRETTMPTTPIDQETKHLYSELEERILARDQIGGSRVYYDLLPRGRPLPGIMAGAVRIHAPYPRLPYHH